jgi:hypothetical protein
VAGFHFARFNGRALTENVMRVVANMDFDMWHAITGIFPKRQIDGIIATRVGLLPSK